MNKLKKVIKWMVIAVLGLLVLAFAGALVQLEIGKRAVLRELAQAGAFKKLSPFGTVRKLSVLPLVDFFADREGLRTEYAVSYLVKADETTILMDTGGNRYAEHPSPLLHNMQVLGVKPADIDMLFISHLHWDHLGGFNEQRTGSFSLSHGPVTLRAIPVYAPAPISPSHWNPGPRVEVVAGPKVLRPGIACLGPIPRQLFLAGRTLENALAINVEGKGIVLIVGCGHQTAQRIIERTQALFDEPVYAVIGGLHLPVHGGRAMFGPFNLQALATDRPPWHGVDEAEVQAAIEAIRKVNPSVVALSPHDSSDWSIEQFRQAFQNRYRDLRVGREIAM
jgi:7,8-dihydropterin-6-yl-methyl-4-(beta-D-ribofuranosyl)aminobenzene 5'-phosphate synthase